MKKILVIENDLFWREEFVRYFLEAEGYVVITADSLVSGIEIAMDIVPDLIVCNLYWPELRASKVYEQFQQKYLLRRIPLIFVKPKSISFSLDLKFIELSSDHYLDNPCTSDELINCVKLSLEDAQDDNQKHRVFAWDSVFTPLPISRYYKRPSAKLFFTRNKITQIARDIKENNERLSSILEAIASEISQFETHEEKDKRKQLTYLRLESLALVPQELELIRNKPASEIHWIVEGIFDSPSQHGERSEDLRIEVENAFIALPFDFLWAIIEEVVENAYHYSKLGSTISVRGATRGAVYCLSVEDNGCGIHHSEIPFVGTPFATFSELSGIGLGLAIVKKILDMFDGLIMIETTLGKGTIINLQLPIAIQDESSVK